MSYDDDMKTTEQELASLYQRVNDATVALQRSPVVPSAIEELIDGFDVLLHAEAPLRLQADPYLTTMLFAAAFRAEKALRHDDADVQRREVRLALEQFRQALRDIITGRPFSADTPVREVLKNLAAVASVPQGELADLLDVSTRQLQRWLAADGPVPTGDDEARIRVVGQIVNHLRHAFTGPGVVAWFYRRHPGLRAKPVTRLADPMAYPDLLGAAAGARAMTG